MSSFYRDPETALMFGDIELEGPLDENLLALLWTLDTSALAAMTFAAVILLALLVDGSEDLVMLRHPPMSISSVLFAVVRSLCATSIRAARLRRVRSSPASGPSGDWDVRS